ncbi:MAG: hypothetical protein Q9227_001511 [Pyrenula ochraceoflavens]
MAMDTSKEKDSIEQNETAAHLSKGSTKIGAEDERFAVFAAKDTEWHRHETKQLLRKVDVRLLPVLVLLYLLNFLDRNNLSQARLGGLEDDLGMTGTKFNTATSILFVGYLLMQLPSNLIITRVRPSIYLGAVMATWGVISACTAAVQSYGGLIAVRICLGIAEAPFFAGAIFLMSAWYTRAELAHRIAWFYSGNSLANMFGGLIAAGVLGNLDGNKGIAGWRQVLQAIASIHKLIQIRWLFIIEGSITIFIAIIAGIVLPNFPSNTTGWLTKEELSYASYRLYEDAREADDKDAITLRVGMKKAFHDYRLYLFILLQHISLLSQTFQYFFPSIVGTLNYGQIETLLLTVPVWFATFLISLLVTWTSGRTADRSIHIIALMILSCIGNIIATASSSVGARFFAMFLMPMGAVSAYQIIVAWVANSFPRPLVKRSACIAICNMIGNTATIYGSYMYPSSDGPQYVPGGSANAVICLIVALLALLIRLVLVRENKILAAAEDNNAMEIHGEALERSTGFRYVL